MFGAFTFLVIFLRLFLFRQCVFHVAYDLYLYDGWNVGFADCAMVFLSPYHL